MDTIYETIKKIYPTASINNSREIIIGKIKNFNKRPSERSAQIIEQLTGLEYDWSDGDWGTGARGSN